MASYNPTDVKVMYQLLLDFPNTPAGLSESTDIDTDYLNNRLKVLERWGFIERIVRGLYTPTEKGKEELYHELNVEPDLFLAFRVVDNGWQMHGVDDICVMRFRDGSVVSFLTGGAAGVEGDRIDLQLDMRRRWESGDAVRDEVEEQRP